MNSKDRRQFSIMILTIITLITTLTINVAVTEDSSFLQFPTPVSTPTAREKESLHKKLKHLHTIKKEIVRWETVLRDKEAKLKTEDLDRHLKMDLENDLKDLREKIQGFREDFVVNAAQINLEGKEVQSGEVKRDLLKEFQELLGPLMDGLRRASERPRKIEFLRRGIRNLEEKGVQLARGKVNVQILRDLAPPGPLSEELEASLTLLNQKEDDLKLETDAWERKLENELSGEKSLVEAGTSFMRDFFGTRGKNFLLSFLVFIGTLWPMTYSRRWVFGSPFFIGPFSWLKRPLSFLYGTLTVVFSFSAALICLQILNDWVLLTLMILFAFSLLWWVKQFAPRFIEQGRLILNLGTVREGERIIWQGIPWMVKSLGIASTLENEALRGSKIKVAAADLVKMYSRDQSKDEPWFPSREGDWVLLNDGSYGQIILQTPELVVMKLGGVSLKHYPTVEYLNQCPQNFSHGFRAEVVFGLDYGLQSQILNLLPLIQKELEIQLAALGGDYAALKPEVDFHSAGESSLNLFISMECPGTLAPFRMGVGRKLQKMMVDLCHRKGWSIPFPQMVVHVQK